MGQKDVWASGKAYEPFIGRWSRVVAREFVSWLNLPTAKGWLDVGCGTGALTQTILESVSPDTVKGVDRSVEFVNYARQQVQDKRASFLTSDAQALPFETNSFDAVISGLVLNFVPVPEQAVAEMTRVAKAGGTVAAYVWDYAGQMQLLRYFWDAAIALNPKALDEGSRFPLCKPEALSQLFDHVGLEAVAVRAIDIDTHFKDFDDYWTPFLGGQGPAPSYVMSLSEENRKALREQLRAKLPFAQDGSIPMMARAWAVCGRKANS